MDNFNKVECQKCHQIINRPKFNYCNYCGTLFDKDENILNEDFENRKQKITIKLKQTKYIDMILTFLTANLFFFLLCFGFARKTRSALEGTNLSPDIHFTEYTGEINYWVVFFSLILVSLTAPKFYRIYRGRRANKYWTSISNL